MRFEASHTTQFRYSRPVLLEPHEIRLRPRSDSCQRLERFRLAVEPTPSLLTETVDAEGNDVAFAWFLKPTDSLSVKTEFSVETLRENAFDYLTLGEGATRLPLEYPIAVREHLSAALRVSKSDAEATREFVQSIVNRGLEQPIPFLGALIEEIYQRFEVVVREHGGPMAPAETLQTSNVACRDMAVLFMACCRTVGIAARFVSGYQEQRNASAKRYMHAWVEVYIPGGGWRGYDPTQGLCVSNRHIAVAASADPTNAAPIRGSFRGDAVARPIEAEITIESTSRNRA